MLILKVFPSNGYKCVGMNEFREHHPHFENNCSGESSLGNIKVRFHSVQSNEDVLKLAGLRITVLDIHPHCQLTSYQLGLLKSLVRYRPEEAQK